jgi:RNA-binding protein 26
MKLDNRPKKLLVKGVGEDHLQALKDWYETTGQLESVEPAAESSAYIVSFKSRSVAEMGLAKGVNIPLIGAVQISWSTGKESTPTQTTKPLAVEPANGVSSSAPQTPDLHHSHLQEEEIVASGWGGDDDEDGMGLL